MRREQRVRAIAPDYDMMTLGARQRVTSVFLAPGFPARRFYERTDWNSDRGADRHHHRLRDQLRPVLRAAAAGAGDHPAAARAGRRPDLAAAGVLPAAAGLAA